MDDGSAETDDADSTQQQAGTSAKYHQYERVPCKQQPGRVSSVINDQVFDRLMKWLTFEWQLSNEARNNHSQLIERAEIASLVRSRMDSLSIDSIDYDDVSEKRSSLSYVIINPSCDLKLEEGDIM